MTPAFNTRPSPSNEGSYEATVAEVISKCSRIAQMQAATSSALTPPLGANSLAEPTAFRSRTSRVVFSSYKVEERAPYLGETRAWIGDATWKRLDRATVEALIRQKV